MNLAQAIKFADARSWDGISRKWTTGMGLEAEFSYADVWPLKCLTS